MINAVISNTIIAERFEDIRHMESLAGYDDDEMISEDFKEIEKKYINFELSAQEFYVLCVKSACRDNNLILK